LSQAANEIIDSRIHRPNTIGGLVGHTRMISERAQWPNNNMPQPQIPQKRAAKMPVISEFKTKNA